MAHLIVVDPVNKRTLENEDTIFEDFLGAIVAERKQGIKFEMYARCENGIVTYLPNTAPNTTRFENATKISAI
jgi:hypothetical protein